MPNSREKAIENVLAQQTGQNLFLFTENAGTFQEGFSKQYEKVRKKWLGSVHATFKDEKAMDHERKTRLAEYKKHLVHSRFETATTEISRFNNLEIRIKGATNVRERNVDIMHFLGANPNESAMELFLLCDMLNRAGAARINVYAPMMPYQREDKKDEGRVPITASLFYRLLETAAAGKLGRIGTMDLHAPQAQGFTTVPVDNLSAIPIHARYLASQEFYEKFRIDLTDITIVSPDAGGAKRAKALAELLRVPYIIFDKTRTKPGEVEFDSNKVNSIQTPYGIWIDDMIDTGGTLVESAKTAREQFGLQGIFALATHGVFSPKRNKDGTIAYYAEEKLRDSGIQVIVTDSIPRTTEYYRQHESWLTDVISIADAFANLALSNRLGLSVSDYIQRLYDSVKDAIKDRVRTTMDDHLLLIPPYETPMTPARTRSNT